MRDFSCRLHARPVTQFTGLKRRRKITEIQSGIKSLKTQQNKQIGTKTRNSMGLLTLTQYPDYRERQTSWRVVCHYAAVTVRRWRGGGWVGHWCFLRSGDSGIRGAPSRAACRVCLHSGSREYGHPSLPLNNWTDVNDFVTSYNTFVLLSASNPTLEHRLKPMMYFITGGSLG